MRAPANIEPIAALLMLAAVLGLPGGCRAQAKVTVDKRIQVGVSRLTLGVTHTQVAWDQGDPAAVARARALLADATGLQNQSIMGWGVGDPEPTPGHYEFASLDRRVRLMRSLGGDLALTLCSAPGWMKTSGAEWNMGDRVADDHVADFARLCQVIARRYADVKFFDIWNEMKGYWANGGYDYTKYTRFYNAVYRALKSVRPEAKVGGFYLPIQGDASHARGYSGPATVTPVTDQDRKALDYWLANKAGADFVSVDRWLVDWNDRNDLTEADQLALTWTYGKVLKDIRAETKLPIWYAEYYTWRHNPGGTPFVACAEASLYYWIIKGAGGTSVTALLWNPSAGETDVNDFLFRETSTPEGGQPTPHYAVYKLDFSHYAV